MGVHFEYEGQHFELPDGTTPEQAKTKIMTHLGKAPKKGLVNFGDPAPKPKEKTTLAEDIKSSFAGVGNTVDRAWSGAAAGLAGLFDDEEADKIYKNMESRIASRDQFAPIGNKEQGISGKAAGALATLPMQVMAMPLSPFETTQRLTEAGEDLNTALKGGAIDTAGNLVGTMLPAGVGKGYVKKILSGAGINAAQEGAVRSAIASTAKTEKAKEEFTPKAEDLIVAGMIGGGIGATHNRRPPKAQPKPAFDPIQRAKELAAQKPVKERFETPTEGKFPDIEQELSQLLDTLPETVEAPKKFPDLYDDAPRLPDIPADLSPLEAFIQKGLDEYDASLGKPIGNKKQVKQAAKEIQPKIETPEEAAMRVSLEKEAIPFVPRSQKGSLELGEIMKGLEEMAARMKPQEQAQDFRNNASGDSSASLEAQSRLVQETSEGKDRVIVRANGRVEPLIGTDAVDAQARNPGDVILQRGIGKDEWTVLDNKNGNVPAAIAQAKKQWVPKKQSGAWTPFSSSKEVNKQYKSFDEFKASLPEDLQEHAAQVWSEMGGKSPDKSVIEKHSADSKLSQYLQHVGRNKSDKWEDNRESVIAGGDMTEGKFKDAFSQGGASRKRLEENLGATYITNVINWGKQDSKAQAFRYLHELDKGIAGIRSFFGKNDEVHKALTSIAQDKLPADGKARQFGELWQKTTKEIYDNFLNPIFKDRQIRRGVAEGDLKDLPIPPEEVYYPHTNTGGWGFTVRRLLENSDGTPKVDPLTGEQMWSAPIQIIRENTKHDIGLARQHMESKFSGNAKWKVDEPSYNPVADTKLFQDKVKAQQHIIDELVKYYGEEDPSVLKAREEFAATVTRQSENAGFGFKQRFKERGGNGYWKGNKPWFDEARNSKDALEVMKAYVEQAPEYKAAYDSGVALSDMAKDPNASSIKNVIKYGQDYKESAFGDRGRAARALEDFVLGGEIGEKLSGGRLGRNWSKNLIDQVRSLSIIRSLGLWRVPFSVTNMVSGASNTIPEMVRIKVLGKGKEESYSATKAATLGLVQGLLYPAREIPQMFGKEPLKVNEKTMQYYNRAKELGMLEISLMDVADQVKESAAGEMGVKIARGITSGNIKHSERFGRLVSFTMLSSMFEDMGYNFKQSTEMAFDLQNALNADLSPHNKPKAIQDMGMAGRFAGTFLSYPVNSIQKAATSVKRAAKNPAEYSAIVAGAGLSLALGGLATGMYGMQEVDALMQLLYKQLRITDKRTPTQWINEELPAELSQGVFSTLTGADFSSAFSAPTFIRNDGASYLFSNYSSAVDMMQGPYNMAKGLVKDEPSTYAAGLMQATPDIPVVKGAVEERYAKKTPEGDLLVPDWRNQGRTVTPRTQEQQNKRYFGVRDAEEAMENKVIRGADEDIMRKTEMRKGVLEKVAQHMASVPIAERMGREYNLEEKLAETAREYVRLGGDGKSFMKEIESVALSQNMRSKLLRNIRNLKSKSGTERIIRRSEALRNYQEANQ